MYQAIAQASPEGINYVLDRINARNAFAPCSQHECYRCHKPDGNCIYDPPLLSDEEWNALL